MQGRDPGLIAIVNGGTSRDPNADDGNLNYKNGENVSLAAKATSDLLVKYGNFGVFARATYFYDWAAASKDGVPSTTKYDFRRRSSSCSTSTATASSTSVAAGSSSAPATRW